MKAVVWHGKRDVRVDDVRDPKIEEPNDILIKLTDSVASVDCGSGRMGR